MLESSNNCLNNRLMNRPFLNEYAVKMLIKAKIRQYWGMPF